jgi:hypothetical protein
VTTNPEQAGQALPGGDPEAADLAADEEAAAAAAATVAADITEAGDTPLASDATQVETAEAALESATPPVVEQEDG